MVKDVKGYFMPKLIDTPEGTDMIGVRKKVNNLLSKARNSAKPDKCIGVSQEMG